MLLLGISLTAAAGLAFQIALTRIFAIAQGYHFGFLAISLALLGFGASGTVLALFPALSRGVANCFMPRLARLALFFALSLVASYLAINHLPFDSYRVAWERSQLVYLVLYYLALVVPFFLSGLALGLPLAAIPERTSRIYAANLAGSGLGCVAALGALGIFDGPGAVIFSAMLAAFGALAFSVGSNKRVWTGSSLALIVLLGALLIIPLPVFELQTSPYKGLAQILRFPDARRVYRGWNAFSRVEVVESSAVRSAPGLSLAYRGALPVQRALFQDAESISPLTDAAPAPWLDALPVTLAYRLRPNARALIVKPGGGIEVLAALNAGAREIVAVEENPLIADVTRTFAPNVFNAPRVRLIAASPRSFVARSRETYDLVHLALSDPFRAVTAGAFALGENYEYTQEAFQSYLNLLNDDGILVVSRWLQLPPTEEVRAGALAVAALESRPQTADRRPWFDGDSHPSAIVGENIFAFRSFSTMLLLVKRTPFTAREIEIAKAFVEERQFDWVAYPGIREDESNRFNVMRENDHFRAFQQLLDADRRARFLSSYEYDVAPTTDDRPFFFHFFKWEQTPLVLQLLGKLWQPFGGSGYLILLALLALGIAASTVLILLPLVFVKREQGRGEIGLLLYFACLGIGFLFVEIPLIQRFILFLDHPVYAFATVVFTLLLASGLGSFVSARVSHRKMLALLVLAIVIYFFLFPFAFGLFLGSAFPVRVGFSVFLLAPLGFLMGIPFPKGLALLNKAPGLIPFAWGINGCASVISSILATMGAMSFGFSVVLLMGAAVYAIALATIIFDERAGRTVRP